jgi:hypothetical protein
MRILVPWKPLVLVWGLLSGMIFFGFVASALIEGTDPFAPGATITHSRERRVFAFCSLLNNAAVPFSAPEAR